MGVGGDGDMEEVVEVSYEVSTEDSGLPCSWTFLNERVTIGAGFTEWKLGQWCQYTFFDRARLEVRFAVDRI